MKHVLCINVLILYLLGLFLNNKTNVRDSVYKVLKLRFLIGFLEPENK